LRDEGQLIPDPWKEDMQNYNVRMILYSSLAIVLLLMVWGWRQIPATQRIGEEALQLSLDQELIVLNGAVRASNQALKYRLLDVLKAEGGERTSRTFTDSPFVAATLLEWDQVQWKSLWHSVKSKTEFQAEELRHTLKGWPLANIAPDEVFYIKVADLQGQPHFAMVVPVRRPNNIPMLGIGIFPATQFGLSFAADQSRDIQVYDNSGFALALSRPAYLGSSLKRDPMVKEMLEGEDVRTRQEWKSDAGVQMAGRAMRVGGSNLIVSVQSPMRIGENWAMQGWLYLAICGFGAVAFNWFLFSNLLKPLLNQLSQAEDTAESLRRQLQAKGEAPVQGVRLRPEFGKSPLRELEFEGDEDADQESRAEELRAAVAQDAKAEVPLSEDDGPVLLSKIVQSSLRRIEDKTREIGVNVVKLDLEGVQIPTDPLQLQTAIEEVVKNSVEAMQESRTRNLTLAATRTAQQVRLTIEDSGCGIPAADLDKVFDPFYSTKDAQGVARGLGLNVVRRVMEELQGTVKVMSHQDPDGSGTRVILEWPVGDIEMPVAARTAESPSKEWPEIEIRRPRVRTLD